MPIPPTTPRTRAALVVAGYGTISNPSQANRVRELAQMQATLETQLAELNRIAAALRSTLHAEAQEGTALQAA